MAPITFHSHAVKEFFWESPRTPIRVIYEYSQSLELSKSMFLSGIYKIKHTEDSPKCFACEGEQLQGNNQLHLIG